ncbi:Hypothetical predicted protein [Mytilus galloprovincialis]|uniref:TIR domain-containing protein n=1 Tax=Mytilus galloprovincialis TaxID=29158 RepID=A0A8B6GT79_MYTGA|nr:Hypothetical predicted protein [Mytilus galloprovincialis]
MKLNLMYIDHVQIEHKKLSLFAAKQEEHQIVHAVIDLMLTLLDNPLQNRRRIAHNIEKLQQNIKTNPKHLNTLADLAVLYRTINEEDKAVLIYETINEILISNDPNDIEEKAVCVLEQGYAVLCDEFSQNEFEAQHKLADSLQRMQLEKNISAGKKHDLLSQASKHTIIAQQVVYRSLNCKTKDDVCYGKKSSMEMFKKGIQHIRNTAYPKEHIYIWKYYYAKACNSATLITSCNDTKAVKLYWSIIKQLPKHNKQYTVYRARAYACIGHRLVTPNEVFHKDIKQSKLSHEKKFQAFIKNPLSAFDYAIAEHPDDEIVLNRKGKSLLFEYKFGTKTIEHLTEADKALSSSISINPRLDHLNFSIRMNVYFEMSSLKHTSADSSYDLLQKALDDGKAAISLNLKGKDVCKVAEICQRLAKFPDFFLYGPKTVTNKEYLHIALDYLNQYICAKGQTYFLAFAIGTIHFDIGEFRTALEWHKRAFLLSDYKRTDYKRADYKRAIGNVRKLCLCIFELEETSSLYIEFINALTFIASKLVDLEFVDELVPDSLWNEYLDKLLRFLDFLKSFPLTTKKVEIAEYLKNFLLKKILLSGTQLIQIHRKSQYTTSTRNDFDYDLKTAILLHPVIMSASDNHDFEYDYFAIMSHENSGWIECFLQKQLSTQMLYNDMIFTACSEPIKYDSCSTLLETTINGINKSRKAILVLSNDCLTREWCVLKSIITETLQKRHGILLVILLDNCDVPPEIDSEHLLYFDFTDDKKIPMEIQNLKLALLSV